MRRLGVLLITLVIPASGIARDAYTLSASLAERGTVLASMETQISIGETVKFGRSGGQRAGFSITLNESAQGGLCLGIDAELEGSWGKGNTSHACAPFEMGKPFGFGVVEEGVLQILLVK